MIEETYAVFAALGLRPVEAREPRPRSARRTSSARAAQTWLRDVAKVLNRRFDPAGRDRAARRSSRRRAAPSTSGSPLLLWHMTRDEFLVRDFLADLALRRLRRGRLSASAPRSSTPTSGSIGKRGGVDRARLVRADHAKRVAAGLLQDRRRLRPPARHASPRSSPRTTCRSAASSTCCTRCATSELEPRQGSSRRPTGACSSCARPTWSASSSGCTSSSKLDYQVAGSLVQLSLPCASALEYAERMVA